MEQIAIYGKGGIGKSTVASNLSASFAGSGLKVMQVGCDPKRDSTRNLVEGRLIPTVLDTLRDKIEAGKTEEDIALEEIAFTGFGGVVCVESGGPEPGVGCAGRGVLTAITILQKLKAFEKFAPDVVIYDVLGDVVCGGFAQPIREGFARSVYLVCSAEFMSLYAANNIAKAIQKHAMRGHSRIAGVIHNSRGDLEAEVPLLEQFASRLKTRVIGSLPREMLIQKAETRGRTVAQEFPDSAVTGRFRELAQSILANRERSVPTPMDAAELERMCAGFLGSLEPKA